VQLNPFKWFQTKSTLQSPSAELLAWFGAGPNGSISSEQALRCPAVQCAVRAISETIGSLPCHVFARGEDGTKKRDTNHAAEPLVAVEVNPWTSAGALRQQLVVDALTEGNGYGAVIKADNKPREIHRLAPKSTRIEISDSGEPLYIFNGPKGERRYAYDEVVHVPAPITRDGYSGIAPVQLASDAIRFALELEQHGVKLFKNAARPGGVLKSKGKISPEALARLRSSWSAMFSGTENTGGTPILEELEWQQLTLTSVDAQYHELRGFAVSEIARAFRVPPVLLMDYGRATFHNSQTAG
jgi:HK97 family phage portal protein